MTPKRPRSLAVLIAVTAGLTFSTMAASAKAMTMGPGRGAAAPVKTEPPRAHRPIGNIRAATSEEDCSNDPSYSKCDGVWISPGDACFRGSSIVGGSLGSVYYSAYGFRFETDLRYSPTCQSYFSVTQVIAGPIVGLDYAYSGKVRRSGGGSPYLMEHGGWAVAEPDLFGWGPDVLSPLVYAPGASVPFSGGTSNGQACLSNLTNDQVTCTPWLNASA